MHPLGIHVAVTSGLCLTPLPCPAAVCSLPQPHPAALPSPPHPQDNFLAAFLLGWGITIGAGLASYPIDTVRRRMMMTSGQAVKYKSSIDCFQQVRRLVGGAAVWALGVVCVQSVGCRTGLFVWAGGAV